MSEPHSLAERNDQRMRAGKVTLSVFDTDALRVHDALHVPHGQRHEDHIDLAMLDVAGQL